MKYYAVSRGRKTGIFTSWAECQKQTQGFKNAKFKSFTSESEAKSWLKNPTPGVKMTTQRSLPKDYAYILYTDGGSRNTGNQAGGHVKADDKAAWAFLVERVQDQKQLEFSGSEYGATNSRMEIMAFLNALKWLKKYHFNEEAILDVLDSKYVLKAVEGQLAKWAQNNWHTSSGPVKNQALWQEVYALLPYFKKLDFKWVKGHDKDVKNIRVDQLVNLAMDQMD